MSINLHIAILERSTSKGVVEFKLPQLSTPETEYVLKNTSQDQFKALQEVMERLAKQSEEQGEGDAFAFGYRNLHQVVKTVAQALKQTNYQLVMYGL